MQHMKFIAWNKRKIWKPKQYEIPPTQCRGKGKWGPPRNFTWGPPYAIGLLLWIAV